MTGTTNDVIQIEHELFGPCLHLKDSPYNLLSWSQLKRNGFKIKHITNSERNDMFKVTKRRRCDLTFKLNHDGMYVCEVLRTLNNGRVFWIGEGMNAKASTIEKNPDISHPHPVTVEVIINKELSNSEIDRINKTEQIHRSLSHPSDKVLQKMIEGKMISDISVDDINLLRRYRGICQICARAKMTKPGKKITNRIHASYVGEVIHIDLMFIQKRIYMIAVDELTGYLCCMPVKDKTKETLLGAIQKITTHYLTFERRVKRICCDRESGVSALKSELASNGIELFRSAADAHDSRIERQIRTVKSKIRATAFDLPYALPMNWLDYLVQYVIQAQNLVINNKTGLTSPFHLLCGVRNIDWVHELSFGDIVLMKIPNDNNQTALDPRSEYGVILGRDLMSNKVFTTFRVSKGTIAYRNIVKRIEYKDLSQEIKHTLSNTKKLKVCSELFDPESLEKVVNETEHPEALDELANKIQFPEHNNDGQLNQWEESKVGGERDDNEEKQESLRRYKEEELKSQSSPTPILDKQDVKEVNNDKGKEPQPSTALAAHIHDVPVTQTKEESGEEVNEKVFQWNIDELMNGGMFCVKEKKEEEYIKMKEDGDNCDQTILMSVNKANNSMGTNLVRAALLKEVEQLKQTGTFSLCSKEEAMSRILIPSTVVVVKKPNGIVKARIVGMGNHQDRSFYRQSDISSPTVRTETILLLCAISAARGSRLYSFDVAGAYLHSNLPESTRISIRFTREVSDLLNEFYQAKKDVQGFAYGILHKGLYGLLEAGALWHKLLTKALLDAGYQQCVCDPCLFVKDSCYFIAVYVDDLLMSSPDVVEVNRIRMHLESMFGKMKYHDENSFDYRGITIHQNREEIKIEQTKKVMELVEDVLGDTRDTVIRKRSTPCALSINNDNNKCKDELMNENKLTENNAKFRTCVAKAVWLSSQTRPDIRYVTSWLAAKVDDPRHQDWKVLRHLCQYLYHTSENGIVMKRNNDLILNGQSDASWCTHKDLSGQSGGIVMLGTSYISSVSKRQHQIARSSTESEIYACEALTTEIEWMRNLLDEMGCRQVLSTEVYVDNHSMITMLESGRMTGKSKHMNWREMRVHQLIKNKIIKLTYRNTGELDADTMTKAKDGTTYLRFTTNVMGYRIMD